MLLIPPREDAYLPNDSMTPDQAEEYHSAQINTLAEAGVDMITAFTLNEVDEAIGITHAALAAGLPVVIAFRWRSIVRCSLVAAWKLQFSKSTQRPTMVPPTT